MGKELTFREIKSGEETKACQLVMDSFSEFVAPDYSEEGLNEFLKYLSPQLMQTRLANNHFVIAALDEGAFAGVIEVRNYYHISLLFVKKEYQNRGIAKKLLGMAITKCRLYNANLELMEVNSSPFAVIIYEKLGFMKVSNEQLKNGIRFTPMTKRLS
jgi:ribosomal protein S18 acetylase RimI-like enzyme